MNKHICIVWKNQTVSGKIQLLNRGTLVQVGQGQGPDFVTDCGRVSLTVADAKLSVGSFATVVTVRASKSFSFFLRDVRRDMPIWIPEYEVAVTEGEDTRTYEQIVADIRAAGRQSKISKMENEPEESFDHAARHTRNMPCVTWLGLSRDIRMFEARPHLVVNPGSAWDVIRPMHHYTPVTLPELGDVPVEYDYFAGRGIGCRNDMTRRLEDGVLPILNVTSVDGEIAYHQKLFVTNEVSPLTLENLHGTHYLVSDQYAKSPTPRTPAQQAETDRVLESEIDRPEETVMYLRIVGENISSAPKYAYIRIPQPNVSVYVESGKPIQVQLDADGLDSYTESGRVFMTASVNGQPMSDMEQAVLLAPGEKVTFQFKIPHRPISRERALALAKTDFEEKFRECRDFWRGKLNAIARISLPEKRIEEMMKAGFLHLDLVCFGNEPDAPVAPVVGIYTPIGTESTPIIQYIESMGDTRLARRAAEYFIKKQREDGFMQNFSNYMSETGLGLWTAAQHYRYSRDKAWLKSVAPNLVKGCDYIMRWSQEHRDEALRGRGYGMISGKVADCAYPYHSFMLNSTTYGGVKNCAEVLAEIGDPNARRIADFASEYKGYIQETLAESFAVAPLIPLADGSWCPAISQWPEINGPMCLFANGGITYSHGMMVECSENGCYDIMYGIVDPNSDFGSFTIKAVTELIALENTSFSQPYYSVHPYVHLLRGETRSFLKEFYNNVSALADRETYTFWEHQYQESPHKTHEEAWFLMRCRWMLFMDDEHSLQLLKGVPRAWLESGKTIAYSGVNTRYGHLSVQAASCLAEGKLTAKVQLDSTGCPVPEQVTIRLPHPDGMCPVQVVGGSYDPATETVTLENFKEEAVVTLVF